MIKYLYLLLVCTIAIAADNSLENLKKVKEFEKAGRTVIRYEHGQNNYFYVLPKKSDKPVPLRVMLHHAGGSGDRCLNESYQAKHRHQHASEEYAVLFLDCRNEQKSGGWWWGWHSIKKNQELYKNKRHPTEQRVLDSIEYVVKNYNIDRNRIYLSGRSMGGTGSLGIGYTNGNIFAAIFVHVPAGAEHFLYRLKSSQSYPDPPPTINTSSHTDGWARGQEDLLAYCKQHKLPMVFGWGPFGHGNVPTSANPAVYDFPWLDIVKNEAYPVFTNASSDQQYPGHKNKQAKDQTGQINGFFRWKNIKDTETEFKIELRLVSESEVYRKCNVPEQASTDVTIRRLQKFKLQANKAYSWSHDGKSGSAKTDAKGLLTIPALIIKNKAILTIK